MNDILTDAAKPFKLIRPKTTKGDMHPLITYTKQLNGNIFFNIGSSIEDINNGLMNLFGPNGVQKSFKRFYYPKKIIWKPTLYVQPRQVEVLDPKAKTSFIMKNIPKFNGMIRDRVLDNRNLIVDFSDLISKAVPTERMFMQKPDVINYVENIYPEIICYTLFGNDKHNKENDRDIPDEELGTEAFTEKVFANTNVISMGKTSIGLDQAGFDKFIISIPYTLKATRFLTPQFIKGQLPIQRNMKINPDLIYQLSLIKFIYDCYSAYNGGSARTEFVREVIKHNVVFHLYCETGVGFTINLKEIKDYMKYSTERFIKIYINRLKVLTMCNTGVIKLSDIDAIDKDEIMVEIDNYYKKSSDILDEANDHEIRSKLKKSFKSILKNDKILKTIVDSKKKNVDEVIESPDDIKDGTFNISHSISIKKKGDTDSAINKLAKIETVFSNKNTTILSDNKDEAMDINLDDKDFNDILNSNDGETEQVEDGELQDENIIEESNDETNSRYEFEDEEKDFDEIYDFQDNEVPEMDDEEEYVDIKQPKNGPITLEKVETKPVYYRSPAEEKRINNLKEKYKSVELNGKKIEDIIGESANIALSKSEERITNKPRIRDEETIKTNLIDFQRSYIENNYQSDIINAVRSLSINKENPLYITGATVNDSSDQFNSKFTYEFTLEDENKTKHKLKFDIPKIEETGIMKINGTEYYLKNQLIRKPIVKIGPDKVYVTTQLNSFQVMRTGVMLNRGGEIIRKLFGMYLDGNKHVSIERGNCELDNKDYLTTLEYDALASNYFLIKINDAKSKYGEYVEIFFSQKAIRERIEKYGIQTGYKDNVMPDHILPIAINYTTKTLISIDINMNSSVNSTIVSLLNEYLKDPEMIEFIKKIKTPKKRLSTKIEIQSFTVPLIAFLNYLFGWTRVSSYFRENQIEFSPKLIKNTNKMSIKFYDGYLYYNQYPIRGALMLNGLTEIDTENYKYEDLNNQGLYINYTYKRFKTRNVVKGWITAKENMLDLKTLQILEALKLPTDFLEIFLYCNDLLVDNQCPSDSDITNYRIRSNEIVSECLFKVINDHYNIYKKRSGKSNKMTIPQDSIISKVRQTEILETYNSISPVGEIRDAGLTTFKGPGGTKVDQAFTLSKRAFDSSYFGVFGMSTPDNANAGITKELTLNPNIQNTLGFCGPIDRSSRSVSSLTPIGEAIMPFVTDYDDPSRIAFASIQSNHVGGMMNASLPIVRTGIEKTIKYQTSETFAKMSKKEGVVTSIDEVEKKVYLTYKDGTKDIIEYKNYMLKNSDAFNQAEYECFVKVGQKVGSRELICGDARFFKKDPITKEVVYTQAINGLLAINEGSYTEDDSSLLSASFADKMVMDFTKRKQISLKASDTLIEYKNVGDEVALGDPIIVFDESGAFEEEQDDEEDSMYKLLFENLDKDTLGQMIHQTPKAPISGTISDMKVYWTVPVNKLSKTLGKFVKAYISKINKEIIEEETFTGKPSEKRKLIDVTKVATGRERINGCEVDPDGGVVIEYFISHGDTMSVGDKVSLNSALKTVTSTVVRKGVEPYTESGKRIDGIFSLISIDARMINSVWYTGWLGKILYDFSKRFAKGFLTEIGADVPKNERDIEIKK